MIGDDIRLKRERLGLSQEQVARAVGTTQQTIQRIESSKTPRSTFLSAVLSHLEIDASEEDSSESSSISPTKKLSIRPENRFFYPLDWPQISDVIRFRKSKQDVSAPHGQSELRFIPILDFGQVSGDWAVLNKHPIDYIERGEPLLYAPDAYAIKISVDDMYPVLKSSEIALVNPALSPLFDEPHIFISSGETDYSVTSTVGYLVSATTESWLIKKFNPHQELILYRDHFPLCHRIVGKFTRR